MSRDSVSLVLAIRPQPGCDATVAAARAAGVPVTGCSLFEIGPLAWEPPPPGGIDGLLLGSANAVRHGGAGLAHFADKPVYAVGEATAEAARQRGFTVAKTGPGVLQALLDSLAGAQLRLLRLTGAEHVPVSPPTGIELELRVVYESVPHRLPPALAKRLSGALVLLHSAAAARHFAAECDRVGVARSGISLAALGPRIAAAAGPGWRRVASAAEPREAALLALARDMCHEPPAG
jgi:uroporphyrinogen-III synthase